MERDEISVLAKLARITLDPQERQGIEEGLDTVIHYIEMLKDIDIEGISPLLSIQQLMQHKDLRQDSSHNTLSKEAFLQNVPVQLAGMIQVPSILQKDL